MPQLSEYESIAQLDVVRDGSFRHLGFLNSPLPDLLVVVGHERYLGELGDSPRFRAVITTPALAERIPSRFALALSEVPIEAFYRIHLAYDHERWSGYRGPTRIDPTASVHPAAFVAEEDVAIGPGTRIGPNATVLERTEIGADCVIHAGVVVGTEGFEVRIIDGERMVVPHKGGTRLGDRVELQANSCVSRALFGGSTTVGDDTKTDNMVHIAHGCQVGSRVRIAACAMLAGSITVGDDVWIGPGAVLSSGLEIGDGASITLGAVVSKSVRAGERVSGHFAVPHRQWIEFVKSIR